MSRENSSTAAGLQKDIAQMRDQLSILRRSLQESLTSWEAFGFMQISNPVAESLRRDIEDREALLQSSQQALSNLDSEPLRSIPPGSSQTSIRTLLPQNGRRKTQKA